MAGVKDKIKLFEKKDTVNSISRETKVSHGAIPKDKTSSVNPEKYGVKPRPAPPLIQRNRHSVIIGQTQRKVPRFLSETDLTKTGNTVKRNADLNIEDICKFILNGKSQEASTEELLHDLWVIDKLRDAYVEKIEEKAESCGENEHEEEAIYENVRSMPVVDNNAKIESTILMEDEESDEDVRSDK